MQDILSDIFYFNKKERRGIYVLLVLIILVGAFNLLLPSLFSKPEIDFEKYNHLISKYDSLVSTEAQQDPIKLFKFDPNKLKIEGWLKLGLNEKQAQVILNYRSKGGYFKDKEDLKKIYSISDKLYLKLEPFIYISQKSTLAKNIKLDIELNTADATTLVQIRGIGPVFAKRIIKFRKLLGGYSSISQLNEVYGIDSLKFESIKENFIPCNLELIQKININKAEFKELLKHPYISYDFTKHLVNTRRKGVYKRVSDVYNENFISDSLFTKLLPYLKTE